MKYVVTLSVSKRGAVGGRERIREEYTQAVCTVLATLRGGVTKISKERGEVVFGEDITVVENHKSSQ
jgi:hypothetical protein